MSFEESSFNDIKLKKKILRREAEFRRQKLARNAGEFVPQQLLENFFKPGPHRLGLSSPLSGRLDRNWTSAY